MSRSEPGQVSIIPFYKKSELGAALMSFFVWGSGQFYVGQGRQRVAIFIALWVGFVTAMYTFWNLQGGLLVLLAGAFFGIYVGYDARRTAKKINTA